MGKNSVEKRKKLVSVLAVADESVGDSRKAQAALKKMVQELPKDAVEFVVTGDLRKSEIAFERLSREAGLRTAVLPANYPRYGNSGEQYRNAHAMSFFKPSTLIVLSYAPEENSTVDHAVRLAKRRGMDIKMVGKG